MTRWVTIGFEQTSDISAGDAEHEGDGGINITTITSGVRSGTRAMRASVVGAAQAVYQYLPKSFLNPLSEGMALGRRVFSLVHFKVAGLPSATVALMRWTSATGGSVRLTSGGKLQLWNDVTSSQIGSDSAATVAAGTWYALELSIMVDTGSIDTLEARVDGVSIASGTELALSDNINTIDRLYLGIVDSTSNFTVDFDDFAMNSDVGANQNSWPSVDGTYGDGKNKIVYGLPISDSQVGSWTGGAGGTTNLYDALNNVSPIGTATETDLTQIENAVNGGGTNYVANLESYTTAGIPSGATVGTVQGLISHAEDAASGTKTGQFKMASNPSGNFQSFTFGENAGALGTWGAVWSSKWTEASINPSLTLGTSPTIELDKTDTGTNTASVCAMCWVAQYNEAVVAFAPPFATHPLTAMIGR